MDVFVSQQTMIQQGGSFQLYKQITMEAVLILEKIAQINLLMNTLLHYPLVVPLCSATCVMISSQDPANAADANIAFIVCSEDWRNGA